jgi:hypothetical protein
MFIIYPQYQIGPGFPTGIMDEWLRYIKENQIRFARSVRNQYIKDPLKLSLMMGKFIAGKLALGFLAGKRHPAWFVVN